MESTGQLVSTAPAFVRMGAHPLRWRLLTALAASDYRVRELVDLLGHPQNLISYHLRLLRGSGLVTAHRSSFDARDSYYHLDLERCAHALSAAGIALHPALRLDPTPPPPATEALLRHRTGGHVEVTSAGSHPKPRMHPNAVRVLREHYGIDIADQRPRHLDTVARHRFDHLISLCDMVREVRPEFGGQPQPTHWSIPDPAVAGDTDQAGYPAFRHMAAEIDIRIRYLVPVLTRVTNPEVQP